MSSNKSCGSVVWGTLFRHRWTLLFFVDCRNDTSSALNYEKTALTNCSGRWRHISWILNTFKTKQIGTHCWQHGFASSSLQHFGLWWKNLWSRFHNVVTAVHLTTNPDWNSTIDVMQTAFGYDVILANHVGFVGLRKLPFQEAPHVLSVASFVPRRNHHYDTVYSKKKQEWEARVLCVHVYRRVLSTS